MNKQSSLFHILYILYYGLLCWRLWYGMKTYRVVLKVTVSEKVKIMQVTMESKLTSSFFSCKIIMLSFWILAIFRVQIPNPSGFQIHSIRVYLSKYDDGTLLCHMRSRIVVTKLVSGLFSLRQHTIVLVTS